MIGRWRLAALAGVLLMTGTLVAVAAEPAAEAAPPVPQSDSFYQPPAGFASTAPGTVLRTRQVTAGAFTKFRQHAMAWQVLYRTTDNEGRPEATVTTVMQPSGSKPSKLRPLVSYQVAEDSAAPQCGIGYQLRRGAKNANIVAKTEIVLIDAALSKGWVVTVPDYEGPNSAYMAGRQAGHAVLDAIRATESFRRTGLNGAATNVGLWGYSGGALASDWAAELQSSYAPELNIAGVAEGGLTVEPAEMLDQINKGSYAGMAMSAIAGLRHAYPQLDTFLDRHLTPAGAAAFALAARQCNSANVATFARRDVDRYFTVPHALTQLVPTQVFTEDTLGQHTPTAPLYLYQAVHDEVAPQAEVDAMVASYCNDGGAVTYHRDILSEHVALVITGAPGALEWLAAQLGGTQADAGCHTSTVASSLLSPSALFTMGIALYDDLLALAGEPIGPDDMS
ncbi:MAG TPA: lipase family protein [Pseudonocardiaceae bacterium]|nr:lipase family protein [Pseudonocardiaceae bacterium]